MHKIYLYTENGSWIAQHAELIAIIPMAILVIASFTLTILRLIA